MGDPISAAPKIAIPKPTTDQEEFLLAILAANANFDPSVIVGGPKPKLFPKASRAINAVRSHIKAGYQGDPTYLFSIKLTMGDWFEIVKAFDELTGESP